MNPGEDAGIKTKGSGGGHEQVSGLHKSINPEGRINNRYDREKAYQADRQREVPENIFSTKHPPGSHAIMKVIYRPAT